ncbi:hypothetical protein M3650_23985 [Paenibacillus sp. MER TA 81-3]|uniref:hypothetical protein n=1 Tax=Paenibacillus sp. MER TA 81-3 TaxID=2939573 RepID=UPI00203E49A6|nr:hypothetical protein [Paenibacillus sp. MER TA 81-3]MCM3341599.1 hypothetical protein [Paenibacillus sp. MER TA 81-3]
MELFINTLLEKRDSESKLVDCERILWLNQSEDCAITISIIRKTGVPGFKRISSIQQELNEGTMIKREHDPYSRFMVSEEILTPKEIRLRDEAWECIKHIVELEPNIYNPKERYEIIKSEMKRTGKGKNLYYKYLRYYWTGGKMMNAILPDSENAAEGVTRRIQLKRWVGPGIPAFL